MKSNGVTDIALSCKIWKIKITAHHEGFGTYEFGGEGTQYHILYSGENGSTTGTHYDVVVKQKDDQAEDNKEAKQNHIKDLSLIHI